uniref:Pex2_Pex12 domain-containing protein n=1 Tax=Meloidogyne hapla TaxID=6305 RepID=A0A1I8BZK1_MELHA
MLDTLLNLLVHQANRQQKKWDEEVHILIQRFVRSVIRLFVMVILLAPNANELYLFVWALSNYRPASSANEDSNSISYSILSYSGADKHHSSTYTSADVLPLSVRPHLLNSEAELDVLFLRHTAQDLCIGTFVASGLFLQIWH